MEEAWELAALTIKRDRVLDELRTIANEMGRTPSMREFAKKSAITENQWLGVHWARWSDLLAEVDMEIVKEFGQEKYQPNELLEPLLQLSLQKNRMPTRPEIRMNSKNTGTPSYNAYKRHFGLQAEVASELLTYGGNRLTPELFADLKKRILKKNPTSDTSETRVDGFVYLMKSGKYYKIGKTNNIDRRKYEIGLQLPEGITPLHSIETDDPSGIEAYWHNRFKNKRMNGEWFDLNSSDVKVFKKRKFM